MWAVLFVVLYALGSIVFAAACTTIGDSSLPIAMVSQLLAPDGAKGRVAQ